MSRTEATHAVESLKTCSICGGPLESCDTVVAEYGQQLDAFCGSCFDGHENDLRCLYPCLTDTRS